jgi:hypothetical protein
LRFLPLLGILYLQAPARAEYERKEIMMDILGNKHIIDMVKEITVAKMSNTNTPPSKEGGEKVAEFMQAIYDKLVELNNKAL